MRPGRIAFLVVVIACAAGACARQPAVTGYAQPHPADYLATHRPSLDALIYGPQGGYVYYNPARQQQTSAPGGIITVAERRL